MLLGNSNILRREKLAIVIAIMEEMERTEKILDKKEFEQIRTILNELSE